MGPLCPIQMTSNLFLNIFVGSINVLSIERKYKKICTRKLFSTLFCSPHAMLCSPYAMLCRYRGKTENKVKPSFCWPCQKIFINQCNKANSFKVQSLIMNNRVCQFATYFLNLISKFLIRLPGTYGPSGTFFNLCKTYFNLPHDGYIVK